MILLKRVDETNNSYPAYIKKFGIINLSVDILSEKKLFCQLF